MITTKIKFINIKTFFLFAILAIASLCWPGRNYNIFPIIISCFIVFKYFVNEFRKDDNIKKFVIYILFYGILIVISTMMHFASLNEIESSTYITVRPHDARWGLTVLKIAASAYILFPIYMLILINIFRKSDESFKLLTLLPIFFLPSLIIALYQSIFDINFLNTTVSEYLSEITGFSSDFNGFRLSLFLLFPLSVLGVIVYRNIWIKVGFVFLSLSIFWVLLLSRSRTAIFGVVLFFFLFPGISIWVKGSKRKHWRLYFISTIIVITVTGFLTTISYQDSRGNSIIVERIQQKYEYFKKFGFRKTLIVSFDNKSFIVKNAPSRLEMGHYAFILTSLSPLAGWGPGGFSRNLDNIRYRKIHRVKYRHFDNANNQYLQMSSDLGIFGIFGNIVLHLFPLRMIYRCRNQIFNLKKRWTVGICFAVICIMMGLYLTGPHIINVEVLWILSCYLSILFIIALTSGYSFKPMNTKISILIFLIITILFTVSTFEKTFGKNGYQSIQKSRWWPHGADRNHYDTENWKEGSVIWCKRNALIEIPLDYPVPEKIELKFLILHPDIDLKPVKVKYGGKNGAKHEVLVKNNLWNTLNLNINHEYILERKNPKTKFQIVKSLILSIDVSRTWVPKEWGVNQDTRELGVAVLIPELQ